jgi:hypothetical protein
MTVPANRYNIGAEPQIVSTVNGAAPNSTSEVEEDGKFRDFLVEWLVRGDLLQDMPTRVRLPLFAVGLCRRW